MTDEHLHAEAEILLSGDAHFDVDEFEGVFLGLVPDANKARAQEIVAKKSVQKFIKKQSSLDGCDVAASSAA